MSILGATLASCLPVAASWTAAASVGLAGTSGADSCSRQLVPTVAAVVSVYRVCTAETCRSRVGGKSASLHTGVGFFLSPDDGGDAVYLVTALHVLRPTGRHTLDRDVTAVFARASCVFREARRPQWDWETALIRDTIPFIDSGTDRNAFYDATGQLDLVAIRYAPPPSWGAYIHRPRETVHSRRLGVGASLVSRVPLFRWTEGDGGWVDTSGYYRGELMLRATFLFAPIDGVSVRTEFLIGSMIPKHSDSGSPVYLEDGANSARLAGVMVGKLAEAVPLQGRIFYRQPSVLLPITRALALIADAETQRSHPRR